MIDEQEKKHVVFDPHGSLEDIEQYCKQIYEEAATRSDKLKPINEENRLFYEGIDQKLIDRAADKQVVRSDLFIPELAPAIDTRNSGVITKLEEREDPVTMRAEGPAPDDAVQERAAWIEAIHNRQLRDCGYLTDIFSDHIVSAEIYRSPSAVKIGWEQVYEQEPEVKVPNENEMRLAAMQGRTAEPYVRWVNKHKGGRPYAELLDPDEFLYEPAVADFQRESEYAGHRTWVSWSKLMNMTDVGEWDKKRLESLREELEAEDSEESSDESIQDTLQDQKGTPYEKGIRDGKILVVEWYINHYDEDQQIEKVWQVVMVANKYAVKKRPTPYRGIKFPFVLLTANRLPNSIEGLSSIDIGKGSQRLYNEVYNSFLDGISYRIFPPMILEPGTDFLEEPTWRPGAIWKLTNSEGLRPFIENPGVMPDLPALMAAISAKIRNLLNAEDSSQGFQAQEYEKATATRLRATGSAKRAMPTNKRYGMGLVAVAKMFLALNQQYHEDRVKFVLPVVVDVPSLTNVSDPEEEKQEALLLFAQALTNPLYQTPTGQVKLRNLWQDVVEKFKKIDIARYVPSEEELLSDQEAQRKLAEATLQKQAVGEEIALS